jgi:hypothetical protein
MANIIDRNLKPQIRVVNNPTDNEVRKDNRLRIRDVQPIVETSSCKIVKQQDFSGVIRFRRDFRKYLVPAKLRK